MPKSTKTRRKRSTRKPGKKHSARKNFFIGFGVLILIIIIGAGIIGTKYYKLIYRENVDLGTKEKVFIFIPSNSNFDKVKEILYKDAIVLDRPSFEWLCEKKGYNVNVKSGRYLIKNHMSNNELINLLRSGKQDPVKLTFNNIRTKQQLVSKVCKSIEADSVSLLELLSNNNFLKKYKLNSDNVMCIFIPNSYDIFWDTPSEKFFKKMFTEYDKFWNENRTKKAAAIGLKPTEIIILASIVYQETKKKDEMSRVAGVYINRINRGIPLQADPTVIYAIGDFSIKRVLNEQTKFDSPYNTYIHRGLPPGPICLPDAIVIDKVLDYEKHDYLYFCAKEDFSGYHNFAETLAQHNQNSQKYHIALNKLKIKK
ncbi:MAG: endolytic transglycosylase MltG [Bacteroidota bacterium]